MNRRARILAGLAVAILLTPNLDAGDWPQWRGPDLTLATSGNGAFDAGDFALEVVWKRPLGPGYSSFSVVGARAVTMFSDGTDDHLVALDAGNGDELWRYRIASTYKGHSSSEDGPRGTPAIHDSTVYGLGPHGHLFAVRLADGEEVWARHLIEDFGAEAPDYGFSTPPVLVDGVLIVQTGVPDGGAVSGFDPTSGERLWSAVADTVGHQSPLVTTLGGERQVLAVSAHDMVGFVPRTGEVLWQFRHNDEPRFEGGWSQPLVLDGDKVLLSYWDDSALYRVAKGENGYAVSELWRTTDLKLHTLMPVVHQGYLYGYNQRFLTCVDPATGKAVWKSRPPGYGGMVLIDGHLVILGPRGELVVVEATPEGYRETARLEVFDRHSLAPASFAGGRLYLRDMDQAAAVAVTRAAGPRLASEPAPAPTGEFGGFLKRLATADDPAALVAGFLAQHPELPIVDDDGVHDTPARIHFVYAGGRGEVGLAGNMLDVGDEISLERVAGSDFYYRTLELEPAGVWEYAFVLDYEEAVPDPRNPRRIETPEGPRSIVATPGWEAPSHLAECPDCATGSLESFTLESTVREDEREIRVYLPAGYGDGEADYPLLVVNHGDRALAAGLMRRSLDHLVGSTVEPIVVAFVPNRRGDSSWRAEAYARMVVEEILPHLRQTYRLRAGAENVAVLGAAAAGTSAADLATRHPEVFGRVAVQSYLELGLGQGVRERIRGGKPTGTLWYVEWRRRDLKSEPGLDQAQWRERDATADSRLLAATLKERGYDVEAHELPGGPGWTSWRARTDRILERLFPLRR